MTPIGTAADPVDQHRRVLACTKSNLAPMPESLAYRLTSAPNGVARVQWLGASTASAASLLALSNGDGNHRGGRTMSRRSSTALPWPRHRSRSRATRSARLNAGRQTPPATATGRPPHTHTGEDHRTMSRQPDPTRDPPPNPRRGRCLHCGHHARYHTNRTGRCNSCMCDRYFLDPRGGSAYEQEEKSG